MLKNKIALTLILAASLLLSACGESAQSKEVEEELILPEQANYKTAQVTIGDYTQSTKSGAGLEYPVRAKLSAKEDDMRLLEILVTPGQEVKQGDALVTFDVETDAADLEALQLSLTRAREKLSAGEADRQEDILEAKEEAEKYSGHKLKMAQLEIEKQQIACEQFVYQTKWEIAQLEEQLEEMEEKAKESTIVAPFDGIVESISSYQPGDLVDQDDVLIFMYSSEVSLIKVSDTMGNFRHNMKVTIETEMKGQKNTYSGTVVSAPNILPSDMSQESTWIKLEEGAVIEDTKGFIYCSGNTEELQNVLLVDKSAIYRDSDKAYVYVLEGDVVKKRFVLLGLSNMEASCVLDGLEEGQSVILD